MNKGGEESKLYEAARNLRMSVVEKCPTSGVYESEEQLLLELLVYKNLQRKH